MKLEECRKDIDAIDREILALLNRRAGLSRRIGEIKLSAGLPVVDETREDTVMRRLIRENDGEIDDRALAGIYREILDESRRIQSEIAERMIAAGGVGQ